MTIAQVSWSWFIVLAGCTHPTTPAVGHRGDYCEQGVPLPEVWGDLLFVTRSNCGGDTVVHELPSMSVVGTWRNPVGWVRPVGDLDGDGVPEQVYADGDEDGESVVGWLSGLPHGDESVVSRWVWHARSPLTQPLLDVLVADLDGDGAADRTLWGMGVGPTQAWKVPEDATGELDSSALEALVDSFEIEPTLGLVTVDIDGDGSPEIVSRSDPFAVQELPLGGSFAPTRVLEGARWGGEPAVDLTGDGLVDVLLDGSSPDEMYVLDGASPAATSVNDLTIGWREPGVRFLGGKVLSDVDGDGQADLLVRTSDEAMIYLGPFTQLLGTPDASLVVGSPGYAFAPTELDGDGRTDLIEVQDHGDGSYELVVHLATELFP